MSGSIPPDLPKTLEDVDALFDSHLPPYFKAIGRIAHVWASLEFQMDRLIWDLADVDHVLGACLTTQMNGPGPRVRCIRVLLEARGWDSSIIKKVRLYSEKMRLTQDRRNRHVHDPLFVSQTGSVVARSVATLNSKLVFERYEPSLDDMEEVFQQSRSLIVLFHSLKNEIRASVPCISQEKWHWLTQRIGPESEERLLLKTDAELFEHPPESYEMSLGEGELAPMANPIEPQRQRQRGRARKPLQS